MDKPRRRAAGRPAGPPNVAADPGQVSANPPSSAGPDAAAVSGAPGPETGSGSAAATTRSVEAQQHRRRQRPARTPGGEHDARPDGAPRDAAAPSIEPPRAHHHRQAFGPPAGRDERRRGESAVERSLRALVSTRTTQLPPTVAMRAREVAAPTRADLIAAEEELVIVRRYYVPPAPLTGSAKPADSRAADSRTPDRLTPESRAKGAAGKRGGRRPADS